MAGLPSWAPTHEIIWPEDGIHGALAFTGDLELTAVSGSIEVGTDDRGRYLTTHNDFCVLVNMHVPDGIPVATAYAARMQVSMPLTGGDPLDTSNVNYQHQAGNLRVDGRVLDPSGLEYFYSHTVADSGVTSVSATSFQDIWFASVKGSPFEWSRDDAIGDPAAHEHGTTAPTLALRKYAPVQLTLANFGAIEKTRVYGLDTWYRGSTGQWSLRQRQNASGNVGGWPLRHRQTGNASGAWPLRHRQ